MLSDSILQFNRILIWDSVPAGETSTADRLFTNIVRPLAAGTDVGVSYTRVESRKELLSLLDGLLEEARAGTIPVVHLESHGSDQFVELASGEQVPWEEFSSSLEAINVACRLRLLVVMGVCQGGYLSSILRPTEPSPVWAVIGPTEEIWNTDLELAFNSFYAQLLTTRDAVEALDALNGSLTVASWQYKFYQCEILYHQAFRKYLRDAGGPEELKRREDRFVAQIVRLSGYDIQAAIKARYDAQQLSNERYWYEKYRRVFLMLDRFPENEARFTMSYEEYIEGSG